MWPTGRSALLFIWSGSCTYVVGSVGDVNQISNLRGVDLLVLRCKQECRNADELQVPSVYLFPAQKSIDQLDAQEERVRDELELHVNLLKGKSELVSAGAEMVWCTQTYHDPVDQDLAHVGRDIGLFADIRLNFGEVSRLDVEQVLE